MAQSPFLQKLDELIEKNLTHEGFGVGELAQAMGYSRSHLHRKLHKECGKSISQYLREYRLEKAHSLMVEEDLNVSEAAYRVGFGSPSYFSKSFNQYFGYTPSGARERKVQENLRSKKNRQGLMNRGISLPKLALPYLFTTLVLTSMIIFLWRWLPGRDLEPDEPNLSVALLPFRSLSQNPENQYLCDGVSDAVARKLSSIQDLRVISRVSTTRFVNERKPLIQIASELNTPFILEGSIQRQKNQVRVEVGLVNGKTGVRLWSENYDRQLEDIFDIENEIAEHVAASLSKELRPTQASRANHGYTDNPEAYEFYMKGLFELRTYTRTGAMKCGEYFQKAIDLDPDFAMAHNWLGHSYMARSSIFGAELDALEGMEMAIVHIERSIRIDPDLKEARPIRAFYYLYHDWDFEKAEEEYILSLNNIEPESYALYADYLNFVRRHEEALAWCEKQEENEPYYPNPRIIYTLYYTGQAEEAIAYAENRLRINRNYWVMDGYGFVLLNSGRYAQAIETFLEIFKIENMRYPRILGWLGAAYAHSGQEDKATEILHELEARKAVSSAGSTGFFTAVVHAALGHKEEALRWIRIAIDDHEMEIPWLISEPQFFVLHDHPVFKEMVEEVGFPT